MSKVLDYENLSEEDKDWLRARGWGNRIPGEGKSDPTPGIVLDVNANGEDILALTPNTGTATNHGLRPVDVNPEGYTEDDYSAWTVADLTAEINDRNENREDAAKIDKGDGKKATLVDALVADDDAHGAKPDENDQQ